MANSRKTNLINIKTKLNINKMTKKKWQKNVNMFEKNIIDRKNKRKNLLKN